MKHLRLLIAAIAAMTSLSMSAQTWTASEVGAGDFYLYNVGKSQFLTRGNGWGTQASTGANALTLTLEEYNGAYKLRTNVNGTGKGLERLGDPVIYTDQSSDKNSTWTFTKVDDASNGPVYTIVSKDNHGGGAGSYMTASADNTIVGPADAVTDDYGRWQLFQAWITNTMPVTNADGWTTSQDPTFDTGNICAEFWNKSGASIKQTVSNLPAGSYELIAVALTRTGMTATLNAGSNTMSIATASTDEANNRSQANTWFNNGNGVNRLEFTHAGGNLEIGLTADNTTGDHWLVWRSFVLLYKGLDLSEFAATLASAVAAAEAVEGTIPTAAYNALAAVVTENNKTYTTTDEYTAATNAIVEATNAAKALQANYTRYNTVKTAAKAIAANVNTNAADEAVASATTTAAIDAAVVTLRAALLAELPNLTIPADPGYIDVTAAMVDNASVRQNTDYWTSYKYPSSPNGGSFGKCANEECEFYQQNFKFYQTLALTPGTWEFGVTGFHRAGNHSTYFFAGDDKILIPGVANTVVNTMAAAQTYFDNGNGKVALKFLVETAQDIEIGIDNQDTQTDMWTIFRDFTLKYYGAPDYSVYEQQWAETVAAANAAKADAANANVTGSELVALNAAIADSPAGSNLKATYLAKIEALENAIQAFTVAAPNYDALVSEIAKANALGVDASSYAITDETTSATALANTQALKVDEYNFVTTNYAYPVALSDNWTSTGNNTSAATFNNEHWSGETRPYKNQEDGNGQGWNAGSWTLDFNQDVTLPAGSYVFKVAGRRASGNNITMSLVVKQGETELGTVSDFPQSNNTRGINKDGATAYDGENSEFANSGNGFGWEWRYVKFDLTEVSTVNIGVSAVATASHQWISFGDYTLQATNEDVAALLEALAQYDAALTAANNAKENADYVNVKGSELKALNDAIGADATLDKSTLATVQAAITTLTNATTTFAGAKNSYDALVAAKAYTALTKVTENIGEGVFQYNTTTNNDLFSAYETAKVAVDEYDTDDETSTAAAAQALVEALDEAIENYENQPLNAPAADKRYKLTLDGKGALTFRTANTDGGYGLPFQADADYKAQTFILTPVIGETNTYTLSFEGLDGETHYVCHGLAAGYNAGTGNKGIRTTTIETEALHINVQATTTDNVFNMFNTVANAKLGSNGGDFYTDNKYSSWSIAEAQQAVVPVAIAADKYATRIFPFVPVIDGVTFYSCEGSEEGDVLTLTEVTEPQANVPYILLASEDVNVNLSGWGLATQDSYTAGWLTGVFAEANVPVGSYVLQTGDDNKQAFFVVDEEEEIAAPAYRAYLTVPATETGDARAFYFSFGEATGINAVDKLINGNAVIYDLQGRKVEHPTRGLYIINGKKVVIK